MIKKKGGGVAKLKQQKLYSVTTSRTALVQTEQNVLCVKFKIMQCYKVSLITWNLCIKKGA